MWNYETSLTWTQGNEGQSEAAGKPALSITPPPEFGGAADRWNPELLLVSAVESCLLLTTLSITQRQKINLTSYESKATGHMEKTPDGLRFSGIDIAITIAAATAEESEKARKAVITAEKYCPVSNAVKCPVKVECSVSPQ